MTLTHFIVGFLMGACAALLTVIAIPIVILWRSLEGGSAGLEDDDFIIVPSTSLSAVQQSDQQSHTPTD